MGYIVQCVQCVQHSDMAGWAGPSLTEYTVLGMLGTRVQCVQCVQHDDNTEQVLGLQSTACTA